MDILRKIGDWAWMNKERLVLAVLVLFLSYRIYMVLNPSTIEEQTAQAAASASASRLQAGGGTGAEGAEGAEGEDGLGGLGGPGARLRNLQRGAQEGAAETEPAADPAEQPIVFTQHMPPKPIPDPNNLPEEWEEEEGRPPMPPPNPLPPAPVTYTALVKDNPFTATKGKDDIRDPRDPDLYLLDIKPWGTGAYRALIQTRTRKWYEEGESFETYQLISIDPDAGTVDIFSEQSGSTRTYRIFGR